MQAETLPPLRDALLELVNQINGVLKDGRDRGVGKGPRKFKGRKRNWKNEYQLRKKRSAKKKGRRKAKFIEAKPKNTQRVPGVSKDYLWAIDLETIISNANGNGRYRVLRMGSNRCFNVRDSHGDPMNLAAGYLNKKLGLEL